LYGCAFVDLMTIEASWTHGSIHTNTGFKAHQSCEILIWFVMQCIIVSNCMLTIIDGTLFTSTIISVVIGQYAAFYRGLVI